MENRIQHRYSNGYDFEPVLGDERAPLKPAIEEYLLVMRESVTALREKAVRDLDECCGEDLNVHAVIANCDRKLSRIVDYVEGFDIACPACWVENGIDIPMRSTVAEQNRKRAIIGIGSANPDDEREEVYACASCNLSLNFSWP